MCRPPARYRRLCALRHRFLGLPYLGPVEPWRVTFETDWEFCLRLARYRPECHLPSLLLIYDCGIPSGIGGDLNFFIGVCLIDESDDRRPPGDSALDIKCDAEKQPPPPRIFSMFLLAGDIAMFRFCGAVG